MTDPADDLSDVLAPQPGAPSPALRDALLRATERRLARDRWARRLGRAAAVAAVFLAGGAAGWLWRTPVAHEGPRAAGDGEPAPAPEVVVVPVPVPVLQPPVADAPGSPGTLLAASEVELRAEQADDPAE